jgi:hypothetical protein
VLHVLTVGSPMILSDALSSFARSAPRSPNATTSSSSSRPAAAPRRPSLDAADSTSTTKLTSQFSATGIAQRDELPVALQEARETEKRVETLRRQAASALTQAGSAAAKQGELPSHVKDALDLYDQAIKLQPYMDGSYEDKARVLAQNYAFDDALKVITKWLKYKPYCRVAYHRQLQILTHQQKWSEATQAALKGLELYPVDPVLSQLLGNALQQAKTAKLPLPSDLDTIVGFSKLYKQVYQSVSASSSTPAARSGHSASLDAAGTRKRVWVFGGATEGDLLRSDLYTLTPATGSQSSLSWDAVTPTGRDGRKPCERELHAAAFVPAGSGVTACPAVGQHGSLFVHGGRDKTASSLSDLWQFDVARSEWRQIQTKGDAPPAVCGHTLNVWKKKLILIGGAESAFACINSVYVFDLDTFTWSRPSLSGTKPYARCGHTSTLLPGIEADALGRASLGVDARPDQLWIVGGWNGSLFKCFFEDVHVLDLVAMSWSQPRLSKRSATLEPRAYHTAALVREPGNNSRDAPLSLLIAGGISTTKGGKLSDCKLLSFPASEKGSYSITQPRVAGSMPLALEAASMTALPGPNGGAAVTVVVFGGSTDQGVTDQFTIVHLDKIPGASSNGSAGAGGSSITASSSHSSSSLSVESSSSTSVSASSTSPLSTSKPKLAPLKPLASLGAAAGAALGKEQITFDKSVLGTPNKLASKSSR